MEALILVHSLYSYECCADRHCFPVPCADVRPVEMGWQWKERLFTKSMLRISQDGQCHVCLITGPKCIYLPSQS